MRLGLLGRNIHRGFVYFLTLLALAMLQTTSFRILLPFFRQDADACAAMSAERAGGYLSFALTVCKNE